MSEPVRSAAIRRALADEGDGLPGDFAKQVAALAEAESAVRARRTDVALFGAFVAMLGVCVAGWVTFVGPPAIGGEELLGLIGRAVSSQPWLVIGVAGVAAVQLLTFRRRAMT
jgi:hypothetical protein